MLYPRWPGIKSIHVLKKFENNIFRNECCCFLKKRMDVFPIKAVKLRLNNQHYKYLCLEDRDTYPILTYSPFQQTLAYSWYHIYKHCFCHIQPFCPALCKFERGTKLYTATKINKNVPLASHNANFNLNVKVILDARAEISFMN